VTVLRGAKAVAETLALFVVVYAAELVAPLVGLGAGWFALALPFDVRPWTLVTSVYAHASMDHLFANAVALLVVGLLVARRTNRVRFHSFFLLTGATSGVATVLVGAAFGGSAAVIGASGAIMALVGYLLAGNLATESLLGRVTLSRRAWAVVVAVLAVGVVLATGGPGVALTAHVTGFLLGLGAGRLHVLRAR